jgi:hypothetical protein
MQSLQNDTIHKFTLKLQLLTNVYSQEYTNTRNSNNDTILLDYGNMVDSPLKSSGVQFCIKYGYDSLAESNFLLNMPDSPV